MFALFTCFLHLLVNFFDGGKTSLIRGGNDYGSDVLTDFKSEMFRNTTSRTIDKTIPVAGRT